MAKAKAKKETAAKAEKKAPAPKAGKAAAGSKKTAAKATAVASPRVVTTVTHDDIAKVAYAIWERKGRPANQDASNWAEAEQELKVR